ncbi:UNVERIFIED_CONTAM: hypothetical protein Sradi_2365800 [Sesamum radiatum]|uniref:Uncharacterized protein n=1 Tax=Sesamum radiatum TaxID=300843 RepID=A0AAW2T5V7_SESRA
MQREMEQMSIQIGLLQCAVSNEPGVAHDTGVRLRIPELKAYNGARDAKEIENFLFYIERYFLAANLEDEARKVGIAEIGAYWLVRDYVKAFSALMLDIRDMSEKDKLFTFMKGLKPWARLELQRQRVTELGSVMAAAEHLTGVIPIEVGGDRKPYPQTSSQGSSNRNMPQENKQGVPQKSDGCFLCDGPHRYRDCPKKQLLNALATFNDKASPVKPVEPKASVAAKKTVPLRAGKTTPALTASHLEEEEAQPWNPWKKGLMFVDVKIHRKPIRAMIDTRATNN